eukprot:12886976-Prorocentrum_lima.AAC.1
MARGLQLARARQHDALADLALDLVQHLWLGPQHSVVGVLDRPTPALTVRERAKVQLALAEAQLFELNRGP